MTTTRLKKCFPQSTCARRTLGTVALAASGGIFYGGLTAQNAKVDDIQQDGDSQQSGYSFLVLGAVVGVGLLWCLAAYLCCKTSPADRTAQLQEVPVVNEDVARPTSTLRPS